MKLRRIFALILVLVLTLALLTPAHAGVYDQVASDTSLTLNNGDVLRVPAEAITGNYIVYRVNNGAYRYYVIDVFESTDGVKELAMLTFRRYVGQLAITNADALAPNTWTWYDMKNVLYAISGALTVRPMYSTFDYYDALGFLLIGGDGSETTEEDFSGTIEVNAQEDDFTLPREIAGNHFMIVNDPASTTPDSIQVFVFPGLESDYLTEGDFASYNLHHIVKKNVTVAFNYDGVSYTMDLPSEFPFQDHPYWYFFRAGGTAYFYAIDRPAHRASGYPFRITTKANYYKASYNFYSGEWSDLVLTENKTFYFSSNTTFAWYWSNSDLWYNDDYIYYHISDSCANHSVNEWGSTSYENQLMTIIQDGWDIKYSTFDYYDQNGNLYFSNSFSGEITEDDSLIDLTLDDGTVIRVPEHLGEADSYFLVMDPVGGTEETAYLIYEFDYYEGVADGTVCDFTRWYGVATTEQVEVSVTDPDTGEISTGVETVTSWEWNYQDYYVTELDILDYGPIVYSTFEYVDGRTDEDDSGGSSDNEETEGFIAWFKGQWASFLGKIDKLIEAVNKLVKRSAGEELDSLFQNFLDFIFHRSDDDGNFVDRISAADVLSIGNILDKIRSLFDAGFEIGDIFTVFEDTGVNSWFSPEIMTGLDEVNVAVPVTDDDPFNMHYYYDQLDLIEAIKGKRGEDE